MLKNYVHETTTGTTWPLALQGALTTGYRTVLGAFGAGKKALLTVRNRSTPSEWETALYTVNADGSINRVAADVRDGTNGVGVLTVFTAGVKDVICDADAALLLALAAKSYWGGTTTNSGNTYAVTVSEPIPTAYFAPMVVLAVINAANTGAATINVNGLGAKAITKSGTTALVAGDLPANAVVVLTYDGAQFQLSTGAGAGTSGGGWTIASKAVAYTVLAVDKSTYFLCSGSFTLSLTAAATMGAGTVIGVKNTGTGSITIDPNGAETINGVSTLALFQGDTVVLICDGTNWHLMDSYTSQGSPTFSNTVTYSSPGTYSFVVPAGVTRARARCLGAGGSGASWGGSNGGGGGGGGGFVESVVAVTPGSTVSVTVGAGGAARSAASSQNGIAGGTSSFGAYCSATGGGGGQVTSAGGTGGSGSGGSAWTGGVGGNGNNGGVNGGGGGAAGLSGNGGAGGNASGVPGIGGSGSGGAAGGAAGAAGTNATFPAGAGGGGASSSGNGGSGGSYGGGGGGSASTSGNTGAGGGGYVAVEY